MVAKGIIPCLDVDKGRVVKGVNFVNITDAGDPVEVVRNYYNQGVDELVFLDITASVEFRGVFTQLIQKVTDEILLTSMDRDGTKSGFDLELLKAVKDIVNVPVIASGGAGNEEDLLKDINIGVACSFSYKYISLW